jgi:hypothetical protein
MNDSYYSNLDLINKYNLLDSFGPKDIIKSIEISVNKLEKEESEGKNTDLEILTYFYLFFTRSPKLCSKDSKNLEVSVQKAQKKIEIYNKKHIEEILLYLTRECCILNDDAYRVNKGEKNFSIVYQFKLDFLYHSQYLPTTLLRRANYEIPVFKVEIFFNKNKISYIGDIFPFWQLSHLDLLKNV